MKRLLAMLGPMLGFMLVFVWFAVRNPDTFFTTGNLLTVAVHTVIVGLTALGMTFVVVSGGIDLSVGSVAALASVTAAVLRIAGWDIGPACAVGICAGASIGLLNGALVVGFGIGPFLVTLGTMGIARGLAKWLAEERVVQADPGWLPAWMSKFPEPPWLVLAPAVWLLLLLALGLAVVLARSRFGVHCYAVGSNEKNARLCGVPVGAVKLRVYLGEPDMARVHLGTKLVLTCDGCAGAMKAEVSYVAREPEFTPPVIYSLENRQKLVFLVEARPDAAAASLKPGQIVDVFLVEPGE